MLVTPLATMAAEPESGETGAEGQGAPELITVSLDEGSRMEMRGEKISLLLRGKPIWSFSLEKATSTSRGTLVRYDLAGGWIAVHARVPLEGGQATEAVLLKKPGRTKIDVIWSGITGLSGDIGERIGQGVRFVDLTGDGRVEIVTGQLSEMARICGREELPLLFRTVFDPASGAFRPVLARRPGLDQPVALTGTLSGDPVKPPLVDQAAPWGASRSAGDGNRADSIRLPREMLDRDPKTAWIPFPGNGAGEFASFRLGAGTYGVTRVGIRALPEGDEPKGVGYDRPKTLLLVTEKGLYRLQFPGEAAKSPSTVTWFALPQPEKTSCLTLVVESSVDPSPKRLMPIAELSIETELDGPGGLTRLARDLKKSAVRREAARLLLEAGEDAIPAIRKMWKELDGQGRRLAVDVLAHVAPEKSIDLLVQVSLQKDDIAAELAMNGLKQVPEAAVAALSKHLAAKDAGDFEKAARVLAGLGTEQALEALIAVAGKGDRPRRAFLREQLALALSRDEGLVQRLWSYVVSARDAGDKEKLFDLLRVADDVPSLQEPVVALASSLYDESREFADRYRALESLGSAGCALTKARLMAAASDDDAHIRLIAVQGLAPCIGEDTEVLSSLRKRVTDQAPLVRVHTIEAFIAPGMAAKAKSDIATLVSTDPWPEVRASATAVARHLPVTDAVPLLEKAAIDKAPWVREAAVGSAATFFGKRVDAIIEGRLAAVEEMPKIRAKAAFVAGARCQSSALPLLFELLRKGAEPLAQPEDIQVAVVAANAMGAIGGEEAKKLLAKARSRSNPHTDKAIDAALKNPGDRCQGKKRSR